MTMTLPAIKTDNYSFDHPSFHYTRVKVDQTEIQGGRNGKHLLCYLKENKSASLKNDKMTHFPATA